MKTEPLPGFVQIESEKMKVGAFDTSSRDSAVEVGEVIATGELVTQVKPGDKVFFKAWSVDRINYNGEWYNYINMETNGILAVIKEDVQ